MRKLVITAFLALSATAANAITAYDPDATWRSVNTGAPKP